MTPMGQRVMAVMPACAAIIRYFSQSARRMSSESAAGMPAPLKASRRRPARAVGRPSISPRTTRPAKVCAMIPGASMVAKT